MRRWRCTRRKIWLPGWVRSGRVATTTAVIEQGELRMPTISSRAPGRRVRSRGQAPPRRRARGPVKRPSACITLLSPSRRATAAPAGEALPEGAARAHRQSDRDPGVQGRRQTELHALFLGAERAACFFDGSSSIRCNWCAAFPGCLTLWPVEGAGRPATPRSIPSRAGCAFLSSQQAPHGGLFEQSSARSPTRCASLPVPAIHLRARLGRGKHRPRRPLSRR